MATLTKDNPREFAENIDPVFEEIPLIASDIIYRGAAVGENSSTGNARPLSGGDNFLGFAEAKADNASGSIGDVNVKVRSRGIVKLTVTGVTADDDLGVAVYASDDNTFTTTASGATQIGKLIRWVTSTTCYVYFESLLVHSI